MCSCSCFGLCSCLYAGTSHFLQSRDWHPAYRISCFATVSGLICQEIDLARQSFTACAECCALLRCVSLLLQVICKVLYLEVQWPSQHKNKSSSTVHENALKRHTTGHSLSNNRSSNLVLQDLRVSSSNCGAAWQVMSWYEPKRLERARIVGGKRCCSSSCLYHVKLYSCSIDLGVCFYSGNLEIWKWCPVECGSHWKPSQFEIGVVQLQ